LDAAGQYKSYEEGKKQLYYLNSIETRSHVALFLKSNREDGKSSNGGVAVPLKLDEICLLKKEVYKKLLGTPYLTPEYAGQIVVTCLSSDYSQAAKDFMVRNCEKRVIFTYGYDLCKSTPNAGGLNNPLQGKLTLK
jgi:hypothetical protein